jgi:GNAT superfamily N-acetyltransferase
VVRRLGPEDWRVWRDVRLAALAESPGAFSSSLDKEQGYAESDWRDRLEPARGLKAVADGGAGLVGGWVPEDRGGAVELYSMWVRPDRRGQGIGDLLVSEVVAWATGNGHPRVDLWVVDGNKVAERLYRRHGFEMTGENVPHPTYPDVLELAMTLPLGQRR